MTEHPNAEDYRNRAERAEQALAERDAEIVRLREALKPWAERETIAEALARPEKLEPYHVSVERRIELMGERKLKHDEDVMRARQALGGTDADNKGEDQ